MDKRGKLTFLLFIFAICGTAVLLHLHNRPAPIRHRPAELFEVVNKQVEAFRQNNFTAAYSQASTNFQQSWTEEEFVEMVQRDSARIMEAERIEFGPWQRRGREIILQVFFINRDGTVAPCIYSLVNEDERWKIDSARWVKGWRTAQKMRGIRS